MHLPTISIGSSGPDVGNWQRFLVSAGLTDWSGAPLSIDEDFGQKTAYATRQWQVQQSLQPSGIIGDTERTIARTQGYIPFVQAAHFTPIYPGVRQISVIVIHTMEAPEKPDTADNVALWFAGDTAPMASAHYCVGEAGIVQCVRDLDVAWHAPGANSNGIGIEHEGYARQSPEEWFDDPSRATLGRSAALAAVLSKRWGIPLRRLTTDDLKAGERGFCGHVDVTNAFSGGKGHTDPGPNFPWPEYLQMVQQALT